MEQRDIDIREKDGVIQSYHYKTDGELMNPGSWQIYLIFPADNTFREEDDSNYFS